MLNKLNWQRIRREAHGMLMAFGLIMATTVLIYLIILHVGLTRGTVAYMIPVLIAAIRWGILASLFAAVLGVIMSAFFFFQPRFSFAIRDPQEVINLILYIVTAFTVSQLATRLKKQLELSRQREIDLRDLYAFSRRLAVAFDVSDIHAAIEDHLTTVLQRRVAWFGGMREGSSSAAKRNDPTIPRPVLAAVASMPASADAAIGATIETDNGEVWLVRAVSPKSSEFGVIAVDLGHDSKQNTDELRARVHAVLADATATLERLGVAHAISEARMRAQTDLLREALIGSVSHELRTPLASILGAATVLSAAPALQHEKKLKALVDDVRNEAERLNNDIQNLLDATRISSDGVKPHTEWADPADIINSAVERCRRRLAGRHLSLNVPHDLPLVHVDPVLVQQALVQIFDNAVKYSEPGSTIVLTARARDGRLMVSVADEGAGLTPAEHASMWDRFARGERQAAITSGSGLGLWIANAFVSANGGSMFATSEGPGKGATLSIELPITQATVSQMETDSDE